MAGQATRCSPESYLVTFEHLVQRVGVGEEVVRRLPVRVLVGITEVRYPQRRPASG